MALPVTWDPTQPAGTDSPALGDDEFRNLKTDLVDLFGIVQAPSTNDWQVLAFRADPAFLRARDTGASGADFRYLNDFGALQFQINTGTEAAPVWADYYEVNVLGFQVFD